MRLWIAAFFALAVLTSVSVTVSPAYAVMEDYPSVKLQGLDKSVGRTVTFEAKVGSTIQYGPLFIKIHACRKSPPIEKPESAAFLQIWEVPPGADKSEWVFSGWMFASSPALSAMDHPVYDIWVLDCLGKEQPNAEAQKAQTKEEADQSNLTPAQTPQATDPNTVPQPNTASPTAPAQETPPGSTATPEIAHPPATTSPSLPSDDSQAPPSETAPQNNGAQFNDDPLNGTTDPSRDGRTAYDFMKENNGTAATPQPIVPNPQIPQQNQSEPAEVEEEAPQY